MRKFLIGLAIGLIAAGWAALLGTLSFVKTVELKTYDQRLRWTADPESVRPEIVIVEIDEDSVRRLDPLVGRRPWPRLVHAEVIDYLARAPAKVIAYDVLFTERDRRSGFRVGDTLVDGESSDAALAESSAGAGTLVYPAEATAGGLESGGESVGQ